jgi:hypothetical protein
VRALRAGGQTVRLPPALSRKLLKCRVVTTLLTLAGPAHGSHAIHHSRLDLDEALALIAPHGPPCGALGQRRGDSVIGHISKGDANHPGHLIPAERYFHGADAVKEAWKTQPAAGETRIRVAASGVNFADVMADWGPLCGPFS